VSTSFFVETVIIGTCVVVIAYNRSVVNTGLRFAVEFNTMVFVGVLNFSVDTSFIVFAGVNGASIMIVTDNLFVCTSYFRITREFITFVIIVTTIRSISDNTSLFFVTFSGMASIRGFAAVRIISVNTSTDRAA